MALSLTPEALGTAGIIADTWRGIRVPRDPKSSFSLGGAERKPAARAVPGTCHHCLWLLEAFCVLGRTGRQPPAHSKFLEDTASVNGDQALSPLYLASPQTGSAHVEMQRCRGLNMA